MRLFDTNVQELKYEVLKEVAKLAFEDGLQDGILNIPEKIVPGPDATMRCCIYKERAIVNERVKLAMGGNKNNPNVIEVLNIACDECPVTQFSVGPACRGCIAHRCENACPRGAISFALHKAVIDHKKCINCGKCLNACQYSAIIKNVRPCETACTSHAISMDEHKKAHIDESKCIACGACVYQCPFGAVMDKSYILDAINLLRENHTDSKVYAIIAPSITGQFKTAKIGQVVSGLKQLGFYNVVEAALGADIVAHKEAKELAEKKFLTSSCCPAFVAYLLKNFPDLKEHISHNLSPMAEIGKYIKSVHPSSKVIFIGPCTAKKAEVKKDSVKQYVDVVLTFEELQALFDSRDIKLSSLANDVLDNASYFGRIFARSGGLSDAVAEALKEQGITDFKVSPIPCSGIEECRTALLKASKGVLKENFIEGMACKDGCIGGAACLTHDAKDRKLVDDYGREAMEKTIKDAIDILNFT
ncbi:4Fe-4S dicluster domain-containing protein [Clostridium tagluense]|uniref:4Fe-4S dicluster domain-containing protein n=1 Tax=Clostridium tagluense TaxID=360422 RepID=UPI001CF1EF07|nr:4Fe-4S dicluster domain-containing protein [Clostridium tagluense]MCB2298563.1 4Fe-4S dicluster domain-containing protein [Clostridium tagluense]